MSRTHNTHTNTHTHTLTALSGHSNLLQTRLAVMNVSADTRRVDTQVLHTECKLYAKCHILIHTLSHTVRVKACQQRATVAAIYNDTVVRFSGVLLIISFCVILLFFLFSSV